MTSVAEEWNARLDRLSARDPDLRLFGADSHYHHRLAPLDEEETRAVEAWLGAPLPAAYRHYVRHVASGGIGPGYGLQWLPALLQTPCSSEAPRAEDAWASEAAANLLRDDDERWARGRFPPLDDAAIEARLADLPETVRASLRPTGDFTRTYEGRRNRYLLDLTSLARREARVRLEAPGDALSSIPLCDYGCGMHAYLTIGARPPKVHVFDYEKETLHVIAPSFEAWMNDWLDEVEGALARGVTRRAAALWR